MENISVYLNELASNGSQNWQQKFSRIQFEGFIDYPVSRTIEELHANLDLDVFKNVDAILSVGGDGTAHTIIQKIAGTDVGLLVVPGGTANDLARSMGAKKDIKHIAHTIKHNTKKKMDLININGVFMATNGGLGFASEVAREINDLRGQSPRFKSFMKFSGKNIYSLFLARKLLIKDIQSYKFKIESLEYNDTFSSPLILINNQPVVGGNFEVAPKTHHSDGSFNVTIFKHTNRLELIQCMLQILSGKCPSLDKNILTFETKEIKLDLLEGANELAFFGDGEIFKPNNQWHIKCYSDFLNIFCPN